MNKPIRFSSVIAFLAACLLALAAGAARAEDGAKARMLVAKPTLGAAYSQTVLVVMPLGDTGQHVGFIINRPLTQTLGTIFPDHAPAQKVVDPVRFGGPVMADTIFAVVRSPQGLGEDSLRLFGDLFVASRAADIDRIIEQTPNDARYFVGFVTWRPGELQAEIAKEFWYVIDPEAELLFRSDLQGLWTELVRRLGFEPNPSKRAI